MCSFIVSALSLSFVNFSTKTSTCSGVNPSISTVLRKQRLPKHDRALSLVVVNTLAPARIFPDNIFLSREWRGILSSCQFLYEVSSSSISVLPEHSSNPSKITRTLFGFWRMYFQTSSGSADRGVEYSEYSRSSRRLSSWSATWVNILSLTRKATWKSNCGFSPWLNKLSQAQSRRIFVQNIVFPVPGWPTTRMFRLLASKISAGRFGRNITLALE